MANEPLGVQFANSIVTDLAPLLALFGEDFAKQYMSESTTLPDHIIFAMAPIGILTAAVSAIRVAGPNLVRGMIGKAREDRASVETELMSSTSEEVSELFDGRSLVRSTGDVEIKEIVLLHRAYESNPNEYGLYTLKDASVKGLLHNNRPKDYGMPTTGLATKMLRLKGRAVLRWRCGKGQNIDQESADTSSDSTARVCLRDCPPNISFNMAPRASKVYLWFAAISGILLQSAVLVFSALITYLPSLSPSFDKDGRPAPSYAYPTFAVGTVVLVIGMFICSFVIDWTTEDIFWNFKEKGKDKPYDMRILWLQKRRFASGQLFKSFAIIQKKREKPCNELLTSWRNENQDEDNESQNPLSWSSKECMAVLGAAAALLGFLGQFEGLRGMNWAVSVAQLCATFVMLFLRSLMRRNLAKDVAFQQLNDDHEMDSLATWLSIDNGWPTGFSKDDELPGGGSPPSNNLGYEVSNSQGDVSKDLKAKRSGFMQSDSEPAWTVLAGTDVLGKRGEIIAVDDLENLNESERFAQRPAREQTAMNVRARLSQLSGWKSATTAAAEMVQSAIFCVMREIFTPQNYYLTDIGHEGGVTKYHHYFRWFIDVELKAKPNPQATIKQDPPREYVELLVPVNREPKASVIRGMPLVSRIEAVLSLWYHCWPDPDVSASTPYEAVRILGKASKLLRRDLGWWCEEDFSVSVFRNYEKNSRAKRGIPFIGVLRGNTSSRAAYCWETNTLPLLMAQHLFTTFMWALADHIPFSAFTSNDTTIHGSEYESTPQPWTSCKLRNIRLSRMVNTVSKLGLGSPQEVYKMIIPPLSHARKLPNEKMVDPVLSFTKSEKEQDSYSTAAAVYTKLLVYCRDFHGHWSDRFLLKAGGALLELLKVLSDRIDGESPSEGESVKVLRNQQAWFMEKLEEFPPRSRAILARLYKFQRREEYQTLLEEISSKKNSPEKAWKDDMHNLFAHTEMHKRVLKHRGGSPGNASSSDRLMPPKSVSHEGAIPDILGWTPLHYVNGEECRREIAREVFYGKDNEGPPTIDCVRPNLTAMGGVTALHMMAVHGNVDLANVLLNQKIMPIQDMSGPLLLAAESGNDTMVDLLLKQEGLDIKKVKDHFGRTPLHLAVKRGNLKVIAALMSHEAATQMDFRGRTPLHFAARLVSATPEVDLAGKVLRTLLDGRAKDGSQLDPITIKKNVNASDVNGFTPLHLAAAANNGGAIELLLGMGANLSSCTNNGHGQWTPLDLAVRLECEDAVSMLIPRLVDNGSAERDRTPLYLALETGCLGCLQRLLNSLDYFLAMDKQNQDSTSKSQQNSKPRTILLNELLAYAAARSTKGAHQIIPELCRKGADINSTFLGLTPLKWAAMYDNLDAAEAITNCHGSDFQIAAEPTNPSYSPILPLIHYAAANSRPKLLMLLLERVSGLSLYQRSPYGNALQVSCLAGSSDNVEALVSREDNDAGEALPDILDEHGWSAFSEVMSLDWRDERIPNALGMDWREATVTTAPHPEFSELPRPKAWDSGMKSEVLILRDDHGLVVEHIGEMGVVGTIRADHPIPPNTEKFSFEITVLKGSDTGRISMGLASGFVSMNTLPGLKEECIPNLVRDREARTPPSQLSLTHWMKRGDACAHLGYSGNFKADDKIRCVYTCHAGHATVSWKATGVEEDVCMQVLVGKKLYPVVGMNYHGARIAASFEEAPEPQEEPSRPPLRNSGSDDSLELRRLSERGRQEMRYADSGSRESSPPAAQRGRRSKCPSVPVGLPQGIAFLPVEGRRTSASPYKDSDSSEPPPPMVLRRRRSKSPSVPTRHLREIPSSQREERRTSASPYKDSGSAELSPSVVLRRRRSKRTSGPRLIKMPSQPDDGRAYTDSDGNVYGDGDNEYDTEGPDSMGSSIFGSDIGGLDDIPSTVENGTA